MVTLTQAEREILMAADRGEGSDRGLSWNILAKGWSKGESEKTYDEPTCWDLLVAGYLSEHLYGQRLHITEAGKSALEDSKEVNHANG